MTAAFLCSWRHRRDARGDLLLGLAVALLTVYIHSFFEWIFISFQAGCRLAGGRIWWLPWRNNWGIGGRAAASKAFGFVSEPFPNQRSEERAIVHAERPGDPHGECLFSISWRACFLVL